MWSSISFVKIMLYMSFTIIWMYAAIWFWPIWKCFNSYPPGKCGRYSRTTYSGAFPRMKNFVFWFKFYWSLFPRVQLTVKKALVKVIVSTEHSTRTLVIRFGLVAKEVRPMSFTENLSEGSMLMARLNYVVVMSKLQVMRLCVRRVTLKTKRHFQQFIRIKHQPTMWHTWTEDTDMKPTAQFMPLIWCHPCDCSYRI